ncbi:hypothetical protein LWI29_023201 [Acer saccharum]|uniref:RNase H type-1 domain-containing protein n=1 Tax=Acer saccharum TaxID=4024 RepID=A0AA39TUL2_ACESA|nr:hypothetical protein LWI29_023201 [Acer saccharum]
MPCIDITFLMFDKLRKDELESWCMVAWGIWSCRNYFIHNNIVKPPLVLLDWVFDLLKELHSSSNITSNRINSTGQADATMAWIPPSSGTLKLNSDAAVKDGSPHIGLGAVIRDSTSKVIVALAKPLIGKFSVEIGEFLTIREGLCLAKRFQLKVSWVEDDAMNVMSGILNNKLENCVAGPIINDIKALLTNVGVINCLAIPRDRNLVAHTLASEVFSSGKEVVWLGVSPACVSSFL